MKITYRKPGGDGESVVVTGIQARIDGSYLYIDDSPFAKIEDGKWRVNGENEPVIDLSVMESTPSSIDLAIQHERDRVGRIIAGEEAGALIALRKDQTGHLMLPFVQRLGHEAEVAVLASVRNQIEHPGQGPVVTSNPWKHAFEMLVTETIAARNYDAKTEDAARIADRILKSAKHYQQGARDREEGRR